MDEDSSGSSSFATSFAQMMPSPERLPHPLKIAFNHISEAYVYASEWARMLYNFYIRDSKSVWSVISGIAYFFFFLVSGLGLLLFFLFKTIYDVLLSWLNFPMSQRDNDRNSDYQQRHGSWRGSVVIFTIFAVSIFTGFRIARSRSSQDY